MTPFGESPVTEATQKSANSDLMRNPELLDASRSRLLIVDLQQKLVPVITDCEWITRSVGLLLRVAELTNVPVCISEQYPNGLGPTIEAITDHCRPEHRFEKLRFSAADEFCRHIDAANGMAQDTLDSRDQIVIVGIETHVCVLQTALDLVGRGFRVYVVADAVGTRHPTDHRHALDRLRDSSGTVCTAECAAFEWGEVAGTDTFRAISRMVRERDSERLNK